jgi:hypothetical protein
MNYNYATHEADALEARQQPKMEVITTDIELTRNLKVCELTNTIPNMQRLSL